MDKIQRYEKTETQILTRTGFCERCAREKRPHTHHKYVAFGNTTHKDKLMISRRIGMYGFTPHIYVGKIHGSVVTVAISCAMIDCCMKLVYDPFKKRDIHSSSEWKIEIWTLKQWLALKNYKHDPDYEI